MEEMETMFLLAMQSVRDEVHRDELESFRATVSDLVRSHDPASNAIGKLATFGLLTIQHTMAERDRDRLESN